MVRLQSWLANYVQRELKRHLLVRPHAVQQRDRGSEGLEVQEMEWVFQPVEEVGDRTPIDMRLAGDRDLALDRLVGRQVEFVRDVFRSVTPSFRRLNAFCLPR